MKKIFKNKYLFVVLLLLFISIGYAFLSSTLSISGIGHVKKSKWDVHFENVDILEGNSLASVAPKTIARTTTELNYTVDFNIPGDVYKFNVDIVNLGTIDAMVSLIGNIELTENQKRFAEYTITYEDGSPLEDKNFLASNSRDTITVTLKYKKDLSEEDLAIVEPIDFNLNLEYSLAKEADTRENTSMIVKDLSGNGNDGIIYGGKYNSDGSFITDGVNDYIDCGLVGYDFGSNYSYVIRVSFIKTSNNNYLFGNWETAGAGLHISSDTIYSNFLSNDVESANKWVSTSANVKLGLNRFYTLVTTYDGINLKLFLDGQLISTRTFDKILNVKASKLPVVIGANPQNGDYTWFTNATYSDALLFNRALGEEEIVSNYTDEINPVNKESLLLHYEFK